MSERVIRADGVELATEAFGAPTGPPILLIMGVMGSMLWWPDEFCARLAERGRYVIRYDNRDTGRSTTYEPGEPGYTLDDMADDALRILDGYGVSTAHLVGLSLGGMIAQLVALQYPARVASVTAISTTPIGLENVGLPGSEPTLDGHFEQSAEVDWHDRDVVIRHMVEDARLMVGPLRSFDATSATKLVERDYDRARNFASATNHTILQGGAGAAGRLHEIQAPFLVIHGTGDPIFPIAHGAALADAVPGASLLRLDGSGHELNEADWETIIAAIVGHTGAATSTAV